MVLGVLGEGEKEPGARQSRQSFIYELKIQLFQGPRVSTQGGEVTQNERGRDYSKIGRESRRASTNRRLERKADLQTGGRVGNTH